MTGYLKDRDWGEIDGVLCKAVEFTPMFGANVKAGEVFSGTKSAPYASVDFYHGKSKELMTGFITHKVDFKNLWEFFKDRGVRDNEEVLFYWTRNHYKGGAAKLFSKAMPRMILLVCEAGTFQASIGFNLGKDEVMVNVHGLMPKEYKVPDFVR